MPIQTRQEQAPDHHAVSDLLAQAFRDEPYSDHTEQFLVERLRKSNAFIPELALVAKDGEQVVGYILLTKLHISNGKQQFESLALAPVAVLPSHQRQGIGTMLIEHAHRLARKIGDTSVLLIGHQDYYPRFGYRRASAYGISFPFDAPDENCMALELVEDGLKNVTGEVLYPKAFFSE